MGYVLDSLAEQEKFVSRLTTFIERSVVIVAGRVRVVISSVVRVRPVHPAKAGPTFKHVNGDRVAALKHPAKLVRLFVAVRLVVGLAPLVEPPGPVLSCHPRSSRTKLLQLREC